MERYLLISDAAKEVQVESHVLRYWEEELHLPIRRNEMGHRYYTEEDVERFKQIKSMKEGGLQLKAIKMILKDGKIDVMMPEDEKAAIKKQEQSSENDIEKIQDTDMAIQIIGSRSMQPQTEETKEEKARRLQWLLQQLIRETLQENNKEICREIKESVVKELDYQFRAQEEREEERNRVREKRDEEHYQKLDELLRQKSKGMKKETAKEDKSVKKATVNEVKGEMKEQEKSVKSTEMTAGKQKKRFRVFGNMK